MKLLALFFLCALSLQGQETISTYQVNHSAFDGEEFETFFVSHDIEIFWIDSAKVVRTTKDTRAVYYIDSYIYIEDIDTYLMTCTNAEFGSEVDMFVLSDRIVMYFTLNDQPIMSVYFILQRWDY